MWHMADCLAPMLFKDHDRTAAAAKRQSVVAPAVLSEAVFAKARTKPSEAGSPVRSLAMLLQDPSTTCRQPDAIRQPRLPRVSLSPPRTRRLWGFVAYFVFCSPHVSEEDEPALAIVAG